MKRKKTDRIKGNDDLKWVAWVSFWIVMKKNEKEKRRRKYDKKYFFFFGHCYLDKSNKNYECEKKTCHTHNKKKSLSIDTSNLKTTTKKKHSLEQIQ